MKKIYRKIQTVSLRLWISLNLLCWKEVRRRSIYLGKLFETNTKNNRRSANELYWERLQRGARARMMRTILDSNVNWQNENIFMLHFPIFGCDVEYITLNGVFSTCVKKWKMLSLTNRFVFQKLISHARVCVCVCGIPQLCAAVVHIERA